MLKQTAPLAFVVVTLTALAACSPSAPASPTPPSEPTATARPPATDTPQPTPVPTRTPSPSPVPTETPSTHLFRDDFSGALQPGWTWQDEVPDRWKLTEDGWLQILAEDPSMLKEGRQSNLLWREPPTGDFVVTVHLLAEPTSDLQQATLYLFQDAENYVAIHRGFCSSCRTGSPGVHMEYKVAGAVGAFHLAVDEPDLYLRLASDDSAITGYYALAPGKWIRVGRIEYALPGAMIGLGATNAEPSAVDDDLVARFDYIEETLPE